MAETSPGKNDELAAKLASGRHSLSLLRSELKTDDVDQDYWVSRLDELVQLLDDIAEERKQTDQQRRLATLYEVSKALGSSLHLDKVLDRVMDSLIDLTGAERGFIMLFTESGELEVRVARNVDRETLEEEEFAISRSVINLVSESGEPVVTTNASEDPRFSGQTSVVVHNLRSIQCVPLQTRGEMMGVVYVDNRVRSGVFDEDDLNTLTAFAAQAAMAIENARLFTLTDEKLAHRVEELSMMQEIDQQLNETLDFDAVMNLTLEWAMRVTNAANGVIALFDLEQGQIRTVAQVGEAPTGVTSILKDKEMVNRDGSLIVPIQREGRAIGVIALDHEKDAPFSFEAQSFVHRVADHAAIAIENAQLYDAVRRANEKKSEFVSVMSHELRIPMTSIKGYADMLEMVGPLNEQQEKFLQIIKSNIQRMSVQVSDLSDVSRIEAGRLNIEIEDDVKLNDILDDVLQALNGEIEEREHNLAIDVPEDLPPLRVDPKRLNQILINLISNAYKYTPDGGSITIRAAQDGDFIRCEVIDTGIGMTPEEQSQLFQTFWRAEDRRVREQPGTGLGLTIAKNLVDLQGGALEVDSEKEAGTTFSFTIPVSG